MRQVLLPILFFTSILTAAEENTPPVETAVPAAPPDVSKISEAFGHMIGKNLDMMGIKFDIAKVIKGLQDAAEGREAPMTEAEYMQAVTAVQESAFKEMAVENLKKSEEFLAKNSTAPGIKILEPGKLQYRIEKEGSGPIVDGHSAPLLRFSGKFLDGTPFASSKEEERINLEEEELIPGFSKALIGMKEGEKRTVFVHPDFGFGMRNYHLPPNSLLTLEIEVVKANTPAEEPLDSLTPPPGGSGNPEIAQPFDAPKAVR